ncbi:MAG: universal stress protein [Rubrobacter sp.]|nr:universal stress protein [Rubrobacter sp.]
MSKENGLFAVKVLLATDGSKDATLVTKAAIDIARGTSSELHVVRAWRSVPSTRLESYVRTQLKQEARESLTEQVRRIKADGGDVAQVHLKEGSAVDEILGLAGEIDAGLIVIGSRGLGPVKRLVMGSVSGGVVHHSSYPVLVMRGGQEAWPSKRIIVGDDGSKAAKRAGELAASIGKLFGAQGLLVRVYPQLPEVDLEARRLNARMIDDELRREESELAERAEEIEKYLGLRPKIRVAVGEVAAELLEAAEEEHAPEKVLVAAGSRGLGTIQRMRLGSVSTKILYAAKGPVLIYPRIPGAVEELP